MPAMQILPVVFSAKVEPEDNVVVFGLGSIRLNVIQAARIVGTNRISGGAHYSFECIGNVQVMRQAFECWHKDRGTPSSAPPPPA